MESVMAVYPWLLCTPPSPVPSGMEPGTRMLHSLQSWRQAVPLCPLTCLLTCPAGAVQAANGDYRRRDECDAGAGRGRC
jgi:hypothetical protein